VHLGLIADAAECLRHGVDAVKYNEFRAPRAVAMESLNNYCSHLIFLGVRNSQRLVLVVRLRLHKNYCVALSPGFQRAGGFLRGVPQILLSVKSRREQE
jgi:hypothetical protein